MEKNTKIKEIITDTGKKIIIFDDVLPFDYRSYAYNFIQNSFYNIGYADGPKIENRSHLYINSNYTNEDCDRLNLLSQIFSKNEEIKKIIGNKVLEKTFVNMSVPAESHFHHTHDSDETIILYYANLDWKPEWAGETLFYDQQIDEIIYASMYKPGRIVIFDGETPHTIRSQSSIAPFFRFTIASFFKNNKKINFKI
jgi:Rps23 Pro-64 3,4-dihydroxylase Tpa1-like proline 4-hydroxylase